MSGAVYTKRCMTVCLGNFAHYWFSANIVIILLGCTVITAVGIADVFRYCDLRVAGSMFISALQLDILWLSFVVSTF